MLQGIRLLSVGRVLQVKVSRLAYQVPCGVNPFPNDKYKTLSN